jgi:DNA repair exonuclease SbcCD nuclease subunit
MKCIVLADLHLDMYLNRELDPFSQIPDAAFDGITHCIVAGDLSNKAQKQWNRCIPWLVERFPDAQLYVMPGNHDYYDFRIDGEDRLVEIAEKHGASFVQKSELISGKHRILCATLWTDFEVYGDRTENMRTASRVMSDYHYIKVARNNFRRLTPAQTAAIHAEHRNWLLERLAEPFDGETTVISHHAPHRRALSAEPSYGPCYASDLEEIIMTFKPRRWLFGHTHHRISFSVGDTELRNISVGYPGQNEPLEGLERFTLELR